MRILVLHSPYLSGAASGENRVVEDEVRLLREGGHEVTAFVPAREDPHGLARAREGFSAVWSRRAAGQVRRLIREQRTDVVHIHNLFPALSPAVVRAAAEEGVPAVATLHAYRLLCLPATLLRDGAICESCLGRAPWRGVVHRCYRGSMPASAALAASIGVHRLLGTFSQVTLYIAVSEFVRRKHLSAGFSPDRIVVRPNFAREAPRRTGPGRYFLFLGRLSPEKGVDTLLQAWRKIDAPLLVVGDGPDAAELRRTAPPEVEFTGQVPATEVSGLLSDARALVLPARSYEGSPRSLLEAYAAGVPVIAASIGSLPEHMLPGDSGLTFPPGDVAALVSAVERLMDDEESNRQGAGAHRLWQDRYSPSQGLETLEAAYRRALELHEAR